MKKLLIIAITILVGIVSSYSQEKNSKKIHGYLNLQPSDEVVQFGAIKNQKTGEVTLTDGEGFFSISGCIGDTLRFHSLGFKDTTWVISGIWHQLDVPVKLNVETNVYSLTEVEVVRYYSYAHFKQAFKDLRVAKTEKDLAKEMVNSWDEEFKVAAEWGTADAKAAQGTFGLSLSSGGRDPIALQREEVKRLEKMADDSKRFDYFMSRENIMHLTGYKGTCLDSFMVFLNTGYNLHYQMQEYNLVSKILTASKDFKDQKENEEWFLQVVD